MVSARSWLRRAPSVSPRFAKLGRPCTSPTFSYDAASSRSSVGWSADSFDKLSRYSGRPLDDELPGLGRARQRLDGIVKLEEKRVRQTPDVVEPAIGARTRLAGPMRLPRGSDDAAGERHDHERGRAQSEPMPRSELARMVGPRIWRREHGQSAKMPAYILSELVHRTVTPGRLLVERLEGDQVDVAAQVTLIGHRRDGARALRILFANGRHDGRVGRQLTAIRARSSDQPVEEHAQ